VPFSSSDYSSQFDEYYLLYPWDPDGESDQSNGQVVRVIKVVARVVNLPVPTVAFWALPWLSARSFLPGFVPPRRTNVLGSASLEADERCFRLGRLSPSSQLPSRLSDCP
jgi:hypothetical protein